MNLEELLKNKDHKVAFFSMLHSENESNEYSKYWVSSVDYQKIGFKSIARVLMRPLFSSEVKNKFNLLLSDFKPDIVHLNNIHSQISPIIAREAYKKKIPVVWTLHDYKLVCPAYTCLRDNKICELCFNNRLNVIKNRCIKNSLSAGFIACLEAFIWNKKKLMKYTRAFISPSEFLKTKMIEGGYNEEKIYVLNNFINKSLVPGIKRNDSVKYYLFFGRLSVEKGIIRLLETAEKMPEYNLKIAGTGPLFQSLVEKYRSAHIEFIGHISGENLKYLILNAEFTIIPSIWYENNPMSIIESLVLGTPVLASAIGGIPELIMEGSNGMLFDSGNTEMMKRAINKMFWGAADSFDRKKISARALLRFSDEVYYNELVKIYANIKAQR